MQLLTRRPAVLDEGEKRAIWEAAQRVATRVPLRCQGTDEFYDLLRTFGCLVDGETVRLPAAALDRVLARIAAQRAASPATAAAISRTLEYSASGQGLHCCDVATDRLRPATTQDLAELSRVVEAIPGLGRAHPTFIPTDVPRDIADLHTFATIILNSSQPYRVSVYSARHLERFFEVECLARGDEAAVRRQPTFAAKLWFNSPFMVTRENVEVAMRARALWGWPVEVSIMPVAGSSTPATLAGCLVHQTAESLWCNVITLAVDDRVCGYRAGALATDMRTGTFTQSGADVDLVQLAGAELTEHIFGGQTTVSRGPTTSAAAPGPQAMMEKSIATLFAILGGTRHFGSLAVLATADVGSLVQLMLDVEMMGYFQRLLDGVAVDPDRLAEEVIAEVAPTGARFLEHEHTYRYFRDELYSPELADRRVALAWAADPVTMLDRARTKAQRLIAEAPNRCPLDEAAKAKIRKVVEGARG